MRKSYSFDFEDKSPKSVAYDCDANTILTVQVAEGQVYLFGNPAGMRTLGRLMIQLAEGGYPEGFHVHIHKDFDSEQPDALCVGV